MKKLILACAIFASAPFAEASTVNWGAQTDTVLLASNPNNTTLLATGSIIRLGYFNLTDVAIQGFHNVGDFSSLNASFTQYDFSTSSEGSGVDGTFAKGSSSISNVNGNLQIYVWVLQSTNNSSVAQAVATATAQAIFYVDKTINPEWTFPAVFNGVANIDIGDLTNATGTAASGANLVVGNFRPNVNRPDIAAQFGAPRIEGIQVVAPIPEPTSAFLIAVGAAGLMMRRRRQS
jgi:hypothetical protein